MNGTAFVCANVADRGRPISLVVHDEGDEWQVLCDGDEHDEAHNIRTLSLRELIGRDPALLELEDLPRGWEATRDVAGAAWRRTPFDPSEDDEAIGADTDGGNPQGLDEDGFSAAERGTIEKIERFGHVVMAVGASAEDDGFSFSIGLFATYGHPEFVVFGQRSDWRHRLINDLAHEVKTGRRYRSGDRDGTILPGFDCRFSAVRTEASYRNYLGTAFWYYAIVKRETRRFPVLQMLYPDRSGVFPDEPGYANYRQPILP